ncbi:autotransporter assembly complex family protein [Porphyrobacter sp. GA68]|uniref:autotransporter assembly complex protein TamA n=1 Tax=Porphyrobacter sp. GA68 TaxID=2883480 RepID=UPI001D19845E|nr:BamA/TamA family outer membrane protein [Porphyrobacter sp. GA68]
MRWLSPAVCVRSATALTLAMLASPLYAQETEEPETPLREQPALPIPQPPPDAALPEIEPIISLEELEDAVPDLPPPDEDALDAPLESIAEFERRIAAEQAGADPAAGAAPPLGIPALADGDPVEEIGDAPIRDAELIAPLPPLNEFDVAPVEFAQGAEVDELPDIAYALRINGLAEVDAEAGADLLALFDDLATLNETGEVDNTAQLTARLTEDSVLLGRILASEGWFAADVQTRIEQGENGSLVAVIDVVPGERYSFGSIDVAAAPTRQPNLIEDTLALQVGDPIVAGRVIAAEAEVAVALSQRGYPFVEVGQRDILLDPETGTGDYRLPIETGPYSVFDGIEVTGDLAFDADHVRTLARFRHGQEYNSRLVDDLRQALVATGLFSTVTVQPVASGEEVPGGEAQYATIVVDQNAGPPRTLAASAGYGTGQGFRVEGSWTHRNLFPPEGALIVSGVAGTLEQGLAVTFRRSNAGQRDRTFQAQAQALYSNFDAFDAYTGRLSVLWSRDSTPIWQKPFTYAYGAEIVATNEQDFNFDTGQLNRRTFFIGGLRGQAGFDQTDSLLDPTRGYRLVTLIQPEGSLQGNFSPYVRAQIEGSAYFPATDALVIAGRVRLGTIQGAERFDIAPSRRLYAGGGGSVRGYGFQQLGPRVALPNPDFDPADDDNDEEPFIFRPIGGRSLNEAAIEVRYRFGDFGVVAFVDAGQSYTATTPRFNNLQYGAGIGARYYTNFGPFRIDVATPLNRREGDSLINVYVSIGQAF